MHRQHHRQIFRRYADWQREVAVDFHSVARGELDRLHWGERRVVEFGLHAEQKGRFLRLRDPTSSSATGARSLENETSHVWSARSRSDDGEIAVGDLRDRVEVGLNRRIDNRPMHAAGVERGGLHDVARRMNHRVAQVGGVAARDHRFLPRRDLMAHQARGVGADRSAEKERLPVLGEIQRRQVVFHSGLHQRAPRPAALSRIRISVPPSGVVTVAARTTMLSSASHPATSPGFFVSSSTAPVRDRLDRRPSICDRAD